MIGLTVLATIEAVALVAVVWLFVRRQTETEQRTTVERAELLNRIQRPDQAPHIALPDFRFEPEEPDEAELVGTIFEAAGDDSAA